ncbi:hypothetical protein GCM10009550_07080 [Actinocorallia libanotica]|uniref:Uncharacterized protein n=1 Tax=Actinocorallia libanotica TaxID=46162 RepID=A0ABN1Q8J3_9ACTN
MAVSVLGGYLLGRGHKTRLAVLLALMAAGGRLPGNAGELLRRTALGGSLDQISGDLRGRLAASGSELAKKAASSPVESLSDILHDRTEALRSEGWTGERAGKLAKTVTSGIGEAGKRAGSVLEAEEPEEEAAEPRRTKPSRDEHAGHEKHGGSRRHGHGHEQEPGEHGRRRRGRHGEPEERGEPARRVRGREAERDEAGDAEDEYDAYAEDEEEPIRRVKARRREPAGEEAPSEGIRTPR